MASVPCFASQDIYFQRRQLNKIAADVAMVQIGAGVVAGLVAGVVSGWSGAGAAAAGAGIAMANLALMTRRLGVCAAGPCSPGQVVGSMAFGAVERLAMTLVGFALAIGTFHLPPLPLIAGFALAQPALLAAR